MSKPTYEERVAAGATLLDVKHGRGWARKIQLRRLDQAIGSFDPFDADKGCGCVAAQLDADRTDGFGRYSDEMDRLLPRGDRWDERAIARLGFNLYRDETVFAGLTEAWKTEVRSRR